MWAALVGNLLTNNPHSTNTLLLACSALAAPAVKMRLVSPVVCASRVISQSARGLRCQFARCANGCPICSVGHEPAGIHQPSSRRQILDTRQCSSSRTALAVSVDQYSNVVSGVLSDPNCIPRGRSVVPLCVRAGQESTNLHSCPWRGAWYYLLSGCMHGVQSSMPQYPPSCGSHTCPIKCTCKDITPLSQPVLF